MEVEFNTKFGKVSVRNIMIDIGYNHLEEGIEIKGVGVRVLEIFGYLDLTTLNSKNIDQLIYENI